MLSLEELSKHIADYRIGDISLDDFEDWFRSNSRGGYHSGNPEIKHAVVAVERAFSQYTFQGKNENQLKGELANAVRPFVAARPQLVTFSRRIEFDSTTENQWVEEPEVGSDVPIKNDVPSPIGVSTETHHFAGVLAAA